MSAADADDWGDPCRACGGHDRLDDDALCAVCAARRRAEDDAFDWQAYRAVVCGTGASLLRLTPMMAMLGRDV